MTCSWPLDARLVVVAFAGLLGWTCGRSPTAERTLVVRTEGGLRYPIQDGLRPSEHSRFYVDRHCAAHRVPPEIVGCTLIRLMAAAESSMIDRTVRLELPARARVYVGGAWSTHDVPQWLSDWTSHARVETKAIHLLINRAEPDYVLLYLYSKVFRAGEVRLGPAAADGSDDFEMYGVFVCFE